VEPIAKPTWKVGFAFLVWGIEMKVLFVSDSEELSKTISLVLKVRWPNLSLFHTSEARESLQLIHREEPHIAMLHLDSVPGDCFDLISQICSFSDVPRIVIGQRDDVMDKVRALEMGADEWIVQSSVPMEFIAKVNALLRRCRRLPGVHPGCHSWWLHHLTMTEAEGFGVAGDNLRSTLPCLAPFRRPACDLFLAQAMTKRLLTRGVSVLSCIHTKPITKSWCEAEASQWERKRDGGI